ATISSIGSMTYRPHVKVRWRSKPDGDHGRGPHHAVGLRLAPSGSLYPLAPWPGLRLIRLGIVELCQHLFLLGFLFYPFNLALPAAANGVAPLRAEQGFYRLATGWTAFAHQP